MHRNVIGVLAVAALASCSHKTTNLAMTHAACELSLPELTSRPLLAPFTGATVTGTKCIDITVARPGVPPYHYAARNITYDGSTISSTTLQKFKLPAGQPAIWFFLIQRGLNVSPDYNVIVNTTPTIVSFSAGDITVGPTVSGAGIAVDVRVGITDSANGGDSKSYLWNLVDATKSLGMAQVSATSSTCPVAGNACPGAEPPNWPATLGGNPATILSAVNGHWLSFTMPASSNKITYEYWMRALGYGAIYDIDPRIINQP